MRWSRVLVVVLLASCTHHATSGPAWPKLHVRDPDGGEALGPHARIQVAAQLERDPTPAPPPKETPLVKPGMPETPVSSGGSVQLEEAPPDDNNPMMTEDQVIEISDDPKP